MKAPSASLRLIIRRGYGLWPATQARRSRASQRGDPPGWTKPGDAAHLAGVALGRFITLEGGEGAGKSTQGRRLAERLRAAGRAVVLTREPGGSPGAEMIRALLVTGGADRWSPTTEALLMYAARRDHVERTISPALARGEWVISDRFADSTRAYQGAGGGVPASFIQALERHTLGEVRPDLTLILDLPAEAGLARVAGRDHAENRFEAKGADFHQRLREGFLAIARVEADRCAVIDATAEPDAVEAAIWDVVRRRLAP
jgi:dTMP kinase